jgi:3-oxoacid CoA-transferase subunit A
MVYFSGDIHGYPWDVKKFCKKHQLTQKDIIVLLGDVGANYYGDHRDDTMKETLAKLPPKILCIHGNHEMRPWHVAGYRLTDWNGGKVWLQDRYPNLLFAKDGEIFTLNGKKYIVK